MELRAPAIAWKRGDVCKQFMAALRGLDEAEFPLSIPSDKCSFKTHGAFLWCLVWAPMVALGTQAPALLEPAVYVCFSSAPSSTCTQWRTGVAVPLCRCVMQPMLAEVMTVGSSACRFPSLRSRSCLDSSGCSTE